MGQDLRLVRVSWNSENIQNLVVLHGFSKESSFPLYTNFYLLLRFANLRHKCMGVDQRLGQVSLNSKNIQNLAVVHGFIKASSFSFYTNFMLLLRLANLPHKCMGIRLDQVSWNSENVQNLTVLLGFIKASSSPFYTNL